MSGITLASKGYVDNKHTEKYVDAWLGPGSPLTSKIGFRIYINKGETEINFTRVCIPVVTVQDCGKEEVWAVCPRNSKFTGNIALSEAYLVSEKPLTPGTHTNVWFNVYPYDGGWHYPSDGTLEGWGSRWDLTGTGFMVACEKIIEEGSEYYKIIDASPSSLIFIQTLFCGPSATNTLYFTSNNPQIPLYEGQNEPKIVLTDTFGSAEYGGMVEYKITRLNDSNGSSNSLASKEYVDRLS